MRDRHLFVVLIVAGLALMMPPRIAAGETPSKEKIDKLIEQLGSESFAEREQASSALAVIGVPALEALRQAAKSEDAEIRKRAEELLPKIEMQAESMRVLAPKRVHLIYKDTPLTEAVADFQKKSGYKIQLHDPDGKLKEHKITLDTGETTFWRAFARFCEKAGLTEASMEDLMRGPQPPGGVPGAPAAPPAVIRPGRALMLGMNGQLVLKEGKAKKCPTYDRSAARIRSLGKSDLFGNVPEGEIILALEVSLEPRLQWQIFQSIHIEKAVDDRDQKLAQVIPQVEGAAAVFGGNPGIALPVVGGGAKFQQAQMQAQLLVRQRIGWDGRSQLVPVQLKKGAKGAQSLKDLSGVLTAQLLTETRPVITADKLDKAAGETFKGDEGGSIKIASVRSEENQTTIQLSFEQPPHDKVVPVQPNVLAGKGVQVGGQLRGVNVALGHGLVDSFNGLSVQDDKGNSLPIDVRQAGMQMSFVQQGNGALKQVLTCTLVCPHSKEKGRPAKVVYLGRKRATVEVPFTLQDVPLP
jgi:hypothetical protein